MSVVALLTDFGLEDHYVAAMKGEILRRAPAATLVDITHLIPPQDVVRGAYELACVYRSFPPGTVFLGVVDPGVGTSRRPLLLRAGGYTWVGPDNGLFALVLRAESGQVADGLVWLAADQQALVLAAERIAERLSATFHGRDLFAPTVGLVVAGTPLGELGEPIAAILDLPAAGGERVLAIDHFGNIITSVRPQPGEDYAVTIAGRRIAGLHRTYAEGQGLILLTSSSGYLEIALPNGNAAALLGVRPGEPVMVERRRSSDDRLA